MAIFDLLSTSALQQLVSAGLQLTGVPDGVSDDLAKAALSQTQRMLTHFANHGQKFTQVLQRANIQAWHVLEIAVIEEAGGASVWQRMSGFLASGDKKALAKEARAFFQDSVQLPSMGGDKKAFYRKCQGELQAARKSKLLMRGGLNPANLAKHAEHFARYVHRPNLLAAQQHTIGRIAMELAEAGHVSLAELMKVPVGQDPCLLLTLSRRFFVRAIETDTELFQGLAFEKLDALSTSQREVFDNLRGISTAQRLGFEALTALLDEHTEQLEEILLSVQEVVVETHAGVQQANEKLDQTNQMLEMLLRSLGAGSSRQILAQEIGSQDDENHRAQVEQARQRVYAVAGSNRQASRIFSNLGKAEMLTGNLDAAWQEFSRAAEMADDPKEKAAAHHHLYRIALERAGLSRKAEDWSAALSHLKLAINKDAAYMPFDTRKYQPERILGAGGFGVTFLCKRQPLADLVAVKALTQENLARNSDEVFSEGMLLRQLDHPSIIRMIDGDYVDHEAKARPYFVMDYFEGTTLDDHVEKHGCLNQEDAVTLAKLIAEGLDAAHRQHIWHRDIKPGNIMVRRDDTGWRVKIIDFGLALRRDLRGSSSATTSRPSKTAVGRTLAYTEDYAAPEQKDPNRQHEVGAVSDIFCFGRTLYYCLFKTPRPDYEDLHNLPESLRRLLTSCAAERIERRPQSFTEVIKDLRKVEFDLAPVLDVMEESSIIQVVPAPKKVAPPPPPPKTAPMPVVPPPPKPVTAAPPPPPKTAAMPAVPIATASPAPAPPPPAEVREWHYSRAGQQHGPVSEAELRALVQQGRVVGGDMVWKKGLAGWVTAASIWPDAPAAPPPPRASSAQVVLDDSINGRLILSVTPEQAYAALTKAFLAFGVTDLTRDEKLLSVAGKTGFDLLSFGQNVTGYVERHTQGAQVLVMSKPSHQMFDTGRGKREAQRILQMMLGNLGSA